MVEEIKSIRDKNMWIANDQFLLIFKKKAIFDSSVYENPRLFNDISAVLPNFLSFTYLIFSLYIIKIERNPEYPH